MPRTEEAAGEDTLVYKAGLVILLGVGVAFGFVIGVSTSRPAATRPPQTVAAVTPSAPATTQPEPPAPAPVVVAPLPATKSEPTPAPTPEPKKPEPMPAPMVTVAPVPEPKPEPKKVEPKKKKVEPKTTLAAGPAPTFDKDILPIFKDKCNECHGAVTTKGGLDLRTYAALMKGGDGGSEVTPGNPDKSYLWEVVANGSMPPPNKSKLTKEQVDKIKAWIVAGAK